MSEHLCHIQIEGLHTVALHEREVCITCRLTHHIQRSTFTFSDAAHMVDMLLVDEQSHALLTLVGDNLFGRKRLVTDG